ncbi:hypothetical protein BDQ17DRAFT_1427309 [Cyathus striatus]|nr:hypothetical protein BDQ17DRAFT_1427309 [Cyathus striatus]
MVNKSDFYKVKGTLEAGIKNPKKWHHHVDDTSTVYFIYLILDPKIKYVYFHVQWNEEQYQEGMKWLEGVFDEYYRPPKPINPLSNDSAKGNIIEQGSPKNVW